MTDSAPDLSILQLRSSAGLYGADRMVLALDEGLRQHGVRSRLLSINNYLLDNQPLHDFGIRAGQDVVLLPCRGQLDMRTVTALASQIDQCNAMYCTYMITKVRSTPGWQPVAGHRLSLIHI